MNRSPRKRRSDLTLTLNRVRDYVYISSDYDRELVDELRKVEAAEFVKADKKWRVPVECVKELVHYTKPFNIEVGDNFMRPHLFLSDRFTNKIRLHSLSKSVRGKIKSKYRTNEFGICSQENAMKALGDGSVVCNDPESIEQFCSLLDKIKNPTPQCSTFAPDLVLKQYQHLPTNSMLGFKKVLIGDEMGLGKTVYSIAAVARLFETQKANRVLVVCRADKKLEWQEEFSNLSLIESQVVKGSPAKRETIWTNPCQVTICNYEQLVTDSKLIHKVNWDVVIGDEATKVKSAFSKRTKAFRSLNSEYLWLLSGTIADNDVFNEAYNIFSMLVPNRWEGFYAFKSRYIVADKWGRTKKFKNRDELAERVSGLLIRRFREDKEITKGGLDKVPNFHEDNYKVELCPETKVMYRAVSNDLEEIVAEAKDLSRTRGYLSYRIRCCEEEMDSTSDPVERNVLGGKIKKLNARSARVEKKLRKKRGEALALFGFLRQISNSPHLFAMSTSKHAKPYLDRFNFHNAHSLKMHKLIELLKTDIPADSKVLVFTCYKRMAKLISQALKSEGISRLKVDGTMSGDEKHAKVSAFKRRQSVRVLVATDCISYGHNLQQAQYVVNFDLPWNATDLSQRNKRIDRGIKTMFDDLYVINLISDTEVEKRILEILKPKAEAATGLFNAKVQSTSGFKGLVKLLEL